ncbi:MAG: primosomal protein N', partial [Anaerolineae bacterium]
VPGSVWISALYAETGANLQDLKRLQAAGIVKLEEEQVLRDPLNGVTFQPDTPPTLTSEQARAFTLIKEGLSPAQPGNYLLHGVTGSGKTEIYLRAIEQVLQQGRQAIALVPEIALTPQTIQRFGARFGDRIGIIHSDLSHGERYDTWRRSRDGKIDVVIGPRSALFAPLPRLGLIVMDEEHEPSYKQEADVPIHLPAYHTREVALELARLNQAAVILGSATPDVETYWQAREGKYTLIELPRRILAHGAGDAPIEFQDLPPVEIVDLRAELRAGNTSIFSRALDAEMHAALARRQQIILFLNRRGSATSVICRDCGEPVRCPRCNNPFTQHEFQGQARPELVCHHCGKRRQMPRECPNCNSKRIRGLGLGTEKLEQLVRAQFPGAHTLRWDMDTTSGYKSYETLLETFKRGEADILIGTQMIAKGLDLPRVTLVGVVNADTGLNLPDFRAGERTFQLLTQVAGRAGRSALGGKVIIQTFNPENYAIRAAAGHNYAQFYAQELVFRRTAAYPPFRPLVRLILSGAPQIQVQQSAESLAERLRDRIRREGFGDAQVIGPAPAFFAKWAGQYRYHLLLRGKDVHALLARFPLPPHWRIDVDPMSVL